LPGGRFLAGPQVLGELEGQGWDGMDLV